MPSGCLIVSISGRVFTVRKAAMLYSESAAHFTKNSFLGLFEGICFRANALIFYARNCVLLHPNSKYED